MTLAPSPSYVPAMNLPRYKAGPVDIWLAAAFTEFVNGFLDGWGGGVGTGAGTGVVTGATTLGAGVSHLHQVFLAVSGVLAAMIGAGLQAVYVWHKTNRFPNPWPPSTGLTNPPFPSPAGSAGSPGSGAPAT